jgi:hypothetical protein
VNDQPETLESLNAKINTQLSDIGAKIGALKADYERLHDAMKHIVLGAQMMIDSPASPPSLKRYATEVRRVASASINP